MSQPSLNRRDFLRRAGILAGGAAVLGPSTLYAENTRTTRLTILHTNDVHSHLDPLNFAPMVGMGGVEARAAMLHDLRMKAVRQGPFLLLDAGDMVNGTPFFNQFRGEPEIRSMNLMRYDATTIGNHEFAGGLDTLAGMARMANFPFICANYDFSGGPMDGLTIPSKIFYRGGLRIGVFGLGIKLEGRVNSRLSGNTRHLDPIKTARQHAASLRENGADFVIALSHLGINASPGDRQLAAAVPGIDLIVGGHSHTLLKAPERVDHPGHPPTYIAQAGWAGAHIGVLQFDISPNITRLSQTTPTILPVTA